MDSPLISSASARYISVDWSLIAMTAVAVALLVVTTVRTAPTLEPGTPFRSGGLEVLSTHETLVAFEDFSFGAQGWTTTAARAASGSRGVYGPFDMGAIAKRFDLPSDTAQVRLAFDLHLPRDRIRRWVFRPRQRRTRDRGRHAVRVIERRDPAARCGGGITPSGSCSINRAMPCRWRSRRCRDRTHPGRSTTSRSSPRPARPRPAPGPSAPGYCPAACRRPRCRGCRHRA